MAMENSGRGPAGTGEFGTSAQKRDVGVGFNVFRASSWLEPRAGQDSVKT